jgi:hypothetical protein
MKIKALALFLGLSLVFSVVACSTTPKRVGAEKFAELASISEVGSMRYIEYLGVADSRACIALHEMSSFSREWSKTVYCAESGEFDPELLKKLASGKLSWRINE